MYCEHFGSHYARSRHQELLAEAERARLVHLARSSRSAGAPRVGAPLPIITLAAHGDQAHDPVAWRRPALWLGTLLVRWGEALQVRALPPEAAPEVSIPW
jgi:hypothetical protein